jgi:hypothetical protein
MTITDLSNWTDTKLACEHNWQACWKCEEEGKVFPQKGDRPKYMNNCSIKIKLEDTDPDTYIVEIRTKEEYTPGCFWSKVLSRHEVAAGLFSGVIFMSQCEGDRLDERMKLDGWVPF